MLLVDEVDVGRPDVRRCEIDPSQPVVLARVPRQSIVAPFL